MAMATVAGWLVNRVFTPPFFCLRWVMDMNTPPAIKYNGKHTDTLLDLSLSLLELRHDHHEISSHTNENQCHPKVLMATTIDRS